MRVGRCTLLQIGSIDTVGELLRGCANSQEMRLVHFGAIEKVNTYAPQAGNSLMRASREIKGQLDCIVIGNKRWTCYW
jgi:hypothetical protein